MSGSTRAAVKLTILRIIEKHGSTYCTVTRKTILILMGKYSGIHIALSTLGYHLANFRRDGEMGVWERYGRNKNGTIFNMPSNRSILKRGMKGFVKSGVRVKKYLLDWAFKGKKLFRRKKSRHSNTNYTVIDRPPRRSVGGFTAISEVLSGTLKTIS